MKKLLIILFAFAGFASVQAQNTAEISFEEEVFDFGELPEGPKVETEFRFTNTGKEPLLISNVKPACSCTASDWTKTAIAPGETGFVVAEYKPKAGKTGFFSKTVSVTTNTEPAVKVLKFTGEIVN